MADRHEFRFVVSGMELSPEQRDRIANAIGQAGALAVSSLKDEQPASFASFVPRGWNGRWIYGLDQGQARTIEGELGVEGEL